jgi:fatty acid desaturase
MNDPVLDDLGEPAPRLPADAQAGERRHPRALIDLAADVLIGACLGVALYFAAVLVSWWWPA